MRDSTTPRDVRLADLAARQFGVVSVGQLQRLGFDRDAIARRVRAGRSRDGLWRRRSRTPRR